MSTDNRYGPESIPQPKRAPWYGSGDSSEITMHYKRADRERLRTKDPALPKGGFFRRNRSLTLIILDVLIVVMLFFIYLIFLRPMEGETRVGPYTFRIESFVFDDEVVLAVDVSPRRGAEGQPVISLTVGTHNVADLAPLPDSSRRIPMRLPTSVIDGSGQITLQIEVGDDQRTATHRVSAED